MSRAGVDSTAIELVRAGLISYRQLNEVHRQIQQAGGGDVEALLVERGWVTPEQLASRRRRNAPKKPRLKLAKSLDLVKGGLLTFKQLNECHQLARQSGGEKTVVDLAVEKGYVTEMQLATLPQEGTVGAKEKQGRRFSSSWDLFRAGAVSLKALNDCHRHIKVDAPGKSLKEALVEKGYVTKEQLAELEAKRAKGELKAKEGSRSAFLEKYAKALADIPPDLREALRREHLRSRGLDPGPEPKKPASKAAKAAAKAAAAAAAKPVDEAELDRTARTIMDMADADDGVERSEPAIDRAAKTFMDMGDQAPAAVEEEEASEEDAVDRSSRTVMSMDEEEEVDVVDRSSRTVMNMDEEDEGGDFRAAKTFMDLGGGEAEAAEEEADDVDRSARTFMELGGEEEEAEADDVDRSARTFMEMGDGEEPSDDAEGEDGDFRAAKTFMDLGGGGDGGGDDGGDEEGIDRSARTMMEAGADDDGVDRSARTMMEGGADEDGPQGSFGPRTFMDLASEAPEAQTAAEGGPKSKKSFMDESSAGGTFMDMGIGEEPATKSGFQREATQLGLDDEGGSTAGATGSKPGAKSKSKGGKSVGSQTEADKSGSKSGTSSTHPGKTDAGSSSADATGSSSAGAGSSSSASQTEADAEAKKVKAKKKKDEADAYSHPLVGKVIGGCRIVKKLGEGGMGAVFLAEHQRLKRRSVIKVVPAHLSSNKQLIARFQREAQAAAVIQHPNVVNVFNVGEENGVHYIEMEYVDGQPLDGILKDKKMLDQTEAVRIIKECCRGLGEAHKHEIVHRDIKPDNIMLTRKGQVKIADFGLARASSEEMELTKVGQILGTPAYMSPEQCQGKPTDRRCDIYSLGATFYAMVTGKRPFTGASVMEIMQKHIDEEPVSPREAVPELSASVAKIILKMMAKKVEDRYQTAEDIVTAIEAFQKEEGTEALLEVQKLLGESFRVIKKLGQGGMGAVYSAKMEQDVERMKAGSIVAVKILNKEVNKEDVERFKIEAETALKIDHDNIIRVLGYKISPEINYIVMEFVEGQSIRDIIRDKKFLPQADVIRIVRETCKGLMKAHSLGIIHRDIKPDNIMLSKAGQVKLADFGIAKHVDAKSEMTQAGALIGTPHYMAPEQCSGKGDWKVTTQADIYALGGTVYFMATGQKPFEGDTQHAIVLQHLSKAPVAPKEVNPEVGEGLNNVILNMLAKKPPRRYGKLEDVLAELDKVEKGQVPRKRRGVDTPLDEEAAGKKVLLPLLVVLVLAVGGGFMLRYFAQRAEVRERAEAGQQMNDLWGKGQVDVRAAAGKRQFTDARTKLDGLVASVKNRGQQASGDDSLYEEFKKREADLRAEVDRQLKARDALVEQKQAEARARADAFRAATLKLDEELGAQRAAIAKEREARVDPRAFQTDIASAARSAALALFAIRDDYGDTAARGPAQGQIDDLGNELNGRVQAVYDAVKADSDRLDAELRLFDLSLDFGRAVQSKFDFQIVADKAVFATSSDRKEWSVPLDAGTKLRDWMAEKKAQEEQFANVGGTVRTEFRAARDSYAKETARIAAEGGLFPYARVMNKFAPIRAATGEDTRKYVDEANRQIDDLDRKRAAAAKALVAAWTKKLDELDGTKVPFQERKFVSDEKGIKDDLKTVYLMFHTAPVAPQDMEARIAEESDDSNYIVVKGDLLQLLQRLRGAAADGWRRESADIEEVAWVQRRFVAASARYDAVMLDAEKALPFAGEPRTIQQLATEGQRQLTRFLPLHQADGSESTYMVRLDQGTYPVGSDESDYLVERPRHQLTLARGLFVDRVEVRVSDYLAFLESTIDGKPGQAGVAGPFCGRHNLTPFCHPEEPPADHGHAPLYLLKRGPDGKPVQDEKGALVFENVERTRPVVMVTWYDAWAFARWAGKRLPSEREWEVAASFDPAKGQKRTFPWGDTFDRTLLACAAKHDDWDQGDLPAAGSSQCKSPCGAWDMAGSVWEWCGDERYEPYAANLRDVDPDFGPGFRVIRGGSFTDFYPNSFRATMRNRARPAEVRGDIGFRCVRDEE